MQGFGGHWSKPILPPVCDQTGCPPDTVHPLCLLAFTPVVSSPQDMSTRAALPTTPISPNQISVQVTLETSSKHREWFSYALIMTITICNHSCSYYFIYVVTLVFSFKKSRILYLDIYLAYCYSVKEKPQFIHRFAICFLKYLGQLISPSEPIINI